MHEYSDVFNTHTTHIFRSGTITRRKLFEVIVYLRNIKMSKNTKEGEISENPDLLPELFKSIKILKQWAVLITFVIPIIIVFFLQLLIWVIFNVMKSIQL